MAADDLFPGFTPHCIRTVGTEIHCVVGGAGPPLLLLHGYPQTHAMWHRIAPRLAQRFTVVCPDLRGYGDSGKPASDATHVTYSEAGDGAGHGRSNARPRLSALSPGRTRSRRPRRASPVRRSSGAVERVAVLDISPTRTMYGATTQAFATAYYHWFFLIQPFDLPEKLIGANPLYYLHRKIGAWSGGLVLFDPRALAEYERCFAVPATIHATCEDYRAAASIDLEHDDADVAAGRKVACPLLALWGEKGVVNRMFDPVRDWGEVAIDVRGKVLPSGHFLAEEAPEETMQELRTFFAA